MRRQWLRVLARRQRRSLRSACPPAPAQADPGVLVFPGMEIHQGTNVCTLGFVDLQTRTAFTAGHCRGDGPVADKDGNVIGTSRLFRDNTPNGATIATDHMITDWEAIALAPDVALNNILPGGRMLVSDPSVVPPAWSAGLPLRRGRPARAAAPSKPSTTAGSRWPTVWSARRVTPVGPVYVVTDDGRAVIVGMFNSTWGQFPGRGVVADHRASRRAKTSCSPRPGTSRRADGYLGSRRRATNNPRLSSSSFQPF